MVGTPGCFHLHGTHVMQVIIRIKNAGKCVHDQLGDVLDIRNLPGIAASASPDHAADNKYNSSIIPSLVRGEIGAAGHQLFIRRVFFAAPGLDLGDHKMADFIQIIRQSKNAHHCLSSLLYERFPGFQYLLPDLPGVPGASFDGPISQAYADIKVDPEEIELPQLAKFLAQCHNGFTFVKRCKISFRRPG